MGTTIISRQENKDWIISTVCICIVCMGELVLVIPDHAWDTKIRMEQMDMHRLSTSTQTTSSIFLDVCPCCGGEEYLV